MRTQSEIFLGLFFTFAAAGLILYSGFKEESRMNEWSVQAEARSIEIGAELYETACSSCHGLQGRGVPGLCPPLNDKHFVTGRMQEVGWSGTMEDYIISTISAGRLASTRPDQYVGNGRPAMPSWAEEYGGPLRPDEIQNLVDFIMNWEQEALARGDEVIEIIGVGTDITVALPEGESGRGELTAVSQGCAGCHISNAIGPVWAATSQIPGLGDRAVQRFTEADYTGSATSAQQYLLESIVLSNAHIVAGYNANIMPQNYGDILTAEQVADLIAYMLTFK